jgi:hypothetical protein
MSAMVSASLLGVAYLVKVSVIVRIYLFPMSEDLHGQNRSM